MAFVSGQDRDQYDVSRMEDDVEQESLVRFIDAFVESLDLQELGIDRAVSPQKGRLRHDGRSLLKLYFHSAANGLRSSRQLAGACRKLIEVSWLMCGKTPDFRTIAEFRKRNADSVGCLLFKGYTPLHSRPPSMDCLPSVASGSLWLRLILGFFPTTTRWSSSEIVPVRTLIRWANRYTFYYTLVYFYFRYMPDPWLTPRG